MCIKLNISEAKTLLQECIVAGAEAVGDDSVLKAMNLDILMHTRSEDVKTRLFALTCTETLWRANGSKLLGLFFSPHLPGALPDFGTLVI